MVVPPSTVTDHLIYPAALPQSPLSVLSWNVLLPNTADGWWTYKMYQPGGDVDVDHMSPWQYRQRLLKDRIQLIDPDVVCMQEVSPLSFESDFDFMSELGYDGVEMFRRGRFRPATFWKTEKCKLVADAVHKDRTLLTTFELVGDSMDNNSDNDDMEQQEAEEKGKSRKGKGKGVGGKGGNGKRYWHVLNCHLQAGPEGKRRVRQIDDGIKACFNAAKKLNEPDPSNPLLVVCGDFNGGSECGAVHYLEKGEVGPTFIEDGEPVSSKVKKSKLSFPMMDVAESVDRSKMNSAGNDNDNDGLGAVEASDSAPPTLVVSELISQMVKEGSEAYQSPQLSDDLVQRLERCYRKYASHPSLDANGNNEKVMDKQDVERWLIDINKKVGRGSEFRTAAKEMGWREPSLPTDNDSADDKQEAEKPRIIIPDDGILTLQGFLNVYGGELRGGKFWGINYDLAIMGEMLPNVGIFQARYDRMYCSSALVPTAVLDTISKTPCPNELEPSDHLPVAASFRVAELN